MPIYTYELVSGECKVCGGCFDLRRPLSRPELKECPLCRKPVRKLIGAVHTPKFNKPLSVSDAKKAGFKVYQKRDKGVYEKL